MVLKVQTKRIITNLFLLFSLNCFSQKESNMGFATLEVYTHSKSQPDFSRLLTYTQPLKVWFKDSCIINEVYKITIEEDAYGVEKAWTEIEKYVFIDLKTMSFYEYSSFSDTAKLLESYKSSTNKSPSGIKSFIEHTIDTNLVNNGRMISDTSLDGVTFKRYRFYVKYNDADESDKTSFTMYFNCNEKLSVITYFKNMSKAIGCPVVRIDEDTESYSSFTSREIKYRSNSLTNEQLKVFDIWERYAKRHPLK